MSVPSTQIDGGGPVSGNRQLLYTAYRLLGTVATPLLAAGLLCAARGRRRFAERFGAWGEVPPVEWWFHGASVGEVQGLIPVIRELRALRPGESMLLSATSPTGLEKGEGEVEETRLLPIDVPWCVNRALSRVSVPRLVLCETELWPVMLHHALRKGIRCSIVNGRISDYTLTRYRALRGLFTPLLQACELVCVPNDEQRARYEGLGVASERIVVTGHTKYDTMPKVTTAEQRTAVYREFFPAAHAESPVVVLGSIRPGEEVWWFDALERAWSSGARVKVIVAPRHAEKFEYFWEKMSALGRRAVRWSQRGGAQQEGGYRGEQGGADSELLLLDTMGRLEDAYSIAQLAFIGATLVDIGGHNPLEAAMYGVPVAVGPYVSVIRDVVGELRAEGAVHDVDSPDDIDGLLARVTSRDRGMFESGKRGAQVWERHRGSSARVAALLTSTSTTREGVYGE
jgi:3-deoxy-D-manno-octulosonic-acid transferase